jgi:hypothetical protein
MFGAKGCLTGTNKRWVGGILLLVVLVKSAYVVPMLFSYYRVWSDVERHCGFSVLAVDIAQKCADAKTGGRSSRTPADRPVIVIADAINEGSGPEHSIKTGGVPSASVVPPDVAKIGGSYVVPLFPLGWGREKPNNIIVKTADFGEGLTVLEFSGSLTVIVHVLHPRSDPIRLVALRRAVEYLRHLENGAVVLVIKTNECLSCIPDKMIREVGRLELWDFSPRSPLAFYNTNTLIYGRQRTSDVTYGF